MVDLFSAARHAYCLTTESSAGSVASMEAGRARLVKCVVVNVRREIVVLG